MIDDVRAARDAAVARIAAVGDLAGARALETELLGKRGPFADFKTRLGGLASVDEKKAAGQAVNEALQAVSEAVERRTAELKSAERAVQLEAERLDLTETLQGPTRGHAHLVTQAWERLEDVFIGLGFQIAEGPEVETDWYNFEALNMPPSHPARSGFDTLFTDYRPDNTVLLRTHTSPVQIRVMQQIQPPIYMVMPGRVFRNETTDARHERAFFQYEALIVDKDLPFKDLKVVFTDFCRTFFESDDLVLRFRPSFFPFTEPSAEIDIQFQSGPLAGRWLEVGGSGQVHPNVVRNMGLDPERFIGFAFGMGMDRFTMLRYGVNDLRLFFDGDVRFLSQFQ